MRGASRIAHASSRRAAALDYVLMLASGTAGVRIAEREAERAIRDGIARAIDELIAVASAIAEIGTPAASAFARSAAARCTRALREERLERATSGGSR